MPIILATQEAEMRRIMICQPGQIMRPYLESTQHKNELVMCTLKVYALSSNPSTVKKKKRKRTFKLKYLSNRSCFFFPNDLEELDVVCILIISTLRSLRQAFRCQIGLHKETLFKKKPKLIKF
jgi:hypothetical protein